MIQINKRQEEILAQFDFQEKKQTSDIFGALTIFFPKVSRITVVRDLNKLVELKFLIREGSGRSVNYQLSLRYKLFRPIDANQYFQVAPDKRDAQNKFNWQIFDMLKDLFLSEEKSKLKRLQALYRKNLDKMPPDALKKETERLVIEFSWKSSVIEGNTYTLLDTEKLIKEGKEAKGHKKEEATMILNQKNAFEYILDNRSDYQKISLTKIEGIHFLLTKGLKITRNLRKISVGVVGTKYRPLDNIHQIRDALNKTCVLVNQEKDAFAKAIVLMIMVAYVQPFTDGNKRTSRLLANAILLANSVLPLSYRSIEEEEYKKAVILFYEQNNISYFKQLFLRQIEFSVTGK